jgi:hypothetical protein
MTMAERLPGPQCGSVVGQEWIDGGTATLTRQPCPGPSGQDAGVGPAEDYAVAAVPDGSLLERLRQEIVIGSIIGLRRGLSAVNPMSAPQLTHDEQQAYALLAQGQYTAAFEVATGFQDYFRVWHASKATGANAGETGVAMVGHLTGFNQATAAATGEDITGKALGTGERIMTGLDALARIASTAMTVGGAVGMGGLGGPRAVRVVSPVYRLAGRDVVVVETSVGRQAFYRSSGANSGRPGEWLPVDEFRPADGWFNKANYTQAPHLQAGEPLHRFGTEEFRRISQQLGEMQIPHGQQVPAGRLESAEDTLNRILDFFNARQTPFTAQRPVPER